MKCKILMFAASPDDQEQLALGREAREIRQRLRSALHRDRFWLETRWAVRARDLIDEINFENPDVVHISGHGSEASEMVFENDAGLSAPVSIEKIREIFDSVKGKIKVVVLNGCYTNKIAKAITKSIDCAIGMKDPVTDSAAIEFSPMFYSSLASGKSVRDAFKQARALARGEDCNPEIDFRDDVDGAALYLLPSIAPATELLAGRSRRLSQKGQLRLPVVPVISARKKTRSLQEIKNQKFVIKPNCSVTLFVPTQNGDVTYYKANPQQAAFRRGSADDFTVVAHPQARTTAGGPLHPEITLRPGESLDFVITFFLGDAPSPHLFHVTRSSSDDFTVAVSIQGK